MAPARTASPPARRARRRSGVRHVVGRGSRLIHVYAGLVLSVLLFLLAVTGGALVYKEAYWRLVYPELRVPAPAPDAAAHARAFAASRRLFGDDVRSVKLPEPGVPAYHLYLREGEAFLSADDARVIDRWRPTDRAMSLLFDLHAHLMAGEAGERVGGVVGLLGVLLAATGLVLWWPARRRFRLANLVPRDLARRRLLLSHRDLGLLATPILLVLLLTGSGLVFYESARVLLNGAFGDRAPATGEAAPAAAVDLTGTAPDAAMLERVQRAVPDARVVFWYPPQAPGELHRFRVKRPCELHPNGRTYVHLDPRGAAVPASDACALPPGERAVHALYPLHAGKTGGQLYKLVSFLGAVALAVLSATGALAYAKRLRPT